MKITFNFSIIPKTLVYAFLLSVSTLITLPTPVTLSTFLCMILPEHLCVLNPIPTFDESRAIDIQPPASA